MTRFLLCHALFVLPVIAACENQDPLDSLSQGSAVSNGPGGGPSGGPSGGPGSDTMPATDTDPTGTSTDAPTTTDATTGDLPTGGETGPTEPGTTGEGLSHAADIQPIWDANCVTDCHTPGGAASGWFVLSGDPYDTLISQASFEINDMQLIVPGVPEQSYLWHKINGTHLAIGGNGNMMPPPPAPALSQAAIDTIGQWILEGCSL
ncbi:hypothetical protein [Nannocystis bainbridge]|uniref:Cytochrome c domain-containing protein n=1 Tax=Nannocystis bainbridge TaxID=2995303 RepID=A0ABT5DPL0_9BACT|nr:hypothetical protein [Nannocystis bainbridge]MDC0715590.1 hypothetical protein [Nannocystis bainbridge]